MASRLQILGWMGSQLKKRLGTALLLWFALACLPAHAAAPIPLQLPSPDGQPGDPKKPVKVYILAGQSNMVGMGDLTGARPEFAKVYYSADPAIIAGATPIGHNERGAPLDWVAVERLSVYDAKVSVLAGAAKPALSTVPVALGTVSENLPSIEGAQTLVVTAEIEVPVAGNYHIRAGFENSSYNVIQVNGKEVYRKDIGGQPVITKIALEAGRRYPVEIQYAKSGSAAFWLERVDMEGKGDLVTITKKDKKFPYLIDSAGNWTVRNDVYFQEARLVEGGKGAPMSAESNKKCLPKCNAIGPEVGFGYVMGTFHDEQVLLIKTAQGNRSLKFDFRPPSSGHEEPNDTKFEGFEYRALIKGVHDTLAKIDKVVPGYQGQGYEVAGFGWFQGHKDSGSPKEEYEKHLVNLIKDLRKEFNAPNLKAVVATVGFHGYRISNTPWYGVWQAQMAVGDAKQHPEFAGSVASVDTRDFWRAVKDSPRSQDYHYHRNAETFMLVGEAMGRAMVRLHGGEAEEIAKSDREAKVAAEMAAEAEKAQPTEAQKAAHAAAMKPLILESSLANFVAGAKARTPAPAKPNAQVPVKKSPFLNDGIDDMVQFYQAAGVRDYDWKPFGELKTATWDYFGFDLPGRPSKANISRSATAGEDDNNDGGAVADDDKPTSKSAGKPKDFSATAVIIPAGLENWFAAEFDAKKAGWKSGVAPFGDEIDKSTTLPDWAKNRVSSRAPKTVCDNDVLLLRQTFDLPPFKEGYRYRIRVSGSAHNNMGEGFAIYVNGRLLIENNEGVLAWRRQGNVPRGVHVLPEFRELFNGGKVTLAVSHFPMNNWSADRYVPAGAPLSMTIEEQKLPPLQR